MATVDLRSTEEIFVVHFGGEFARINAYTLASTLVGLADAAKAANASVNPGYEVEIVVEALEPGSFRAVVRAVYRGVSNLFSRDAPKTIILGVISAFIYQHTLAPGSDVVVTVNDSEVVIQQGSTRIIVPREIHEAVRRVEKSPQFRRGVGQAFDAIARDEAISSFGIGTDGAAPEPPIEIPRARFEILASINEVEPDDVRDIVETAELQITRAILERSRRRWQFVWRGVRISAPIVDDGFYKRFFDHEITVAPGDVLLVRLKIRQVRDPDTGIYINDSNGYEVIEVLEHNART